MLPSLFEIVDHALDHFFQVMLGFKTDELANLLDVWAAPAHVLEARAIGLLIGKVFDRRSAACHFLVSPILACCRSLKSSLSDSRLVVFFA